MKNSGFTLIDILVGTALILIVFLGIFGAYQLVFQVIGQSKNKIIATSIANSELEKIRNLPYQSVGVQGSFPTGSLVPENQVLQNNITFIIKRRVDYVIDPADGIAEPQDDCPNDYKRAEVKVVSLGKFPVEVLMVTDISPENLAQECAETGGVLSVSVFDALGNMVSSPLIEVKNPETRATIKSATPFEGKHYFSLPAATYQVVVSKPGYSQERTYASGEVYNGKTIVTPEIPNPILLEEQVTEISFSIDRVSAFSVNTLSLFGSDYFSDSFLDELKISEKLNLIVSNSQVSLATTTQGYLASGYLISIEISPAQLVEWQEFSFNDLWPQNTDLKYQIYYASGTQWALIPEADLPGNSTGFDISPVDLSGLATTTYSKLKLRANFSSADTTVSPILYDWQISWLTAEPTSIPNVTFNLRGQKLVGKDDGEEPIYKYSTAISSDFSGHKDILDLEWDNYTFSVEPATGLDLVATQPFPQPIGLSPNTTLNVNLYLKAENSLLVTVKDNATLSPIFNANVRLYNTGLGYDKTQPTNEKGQTYFIPLQIATYNLEVEAPGYAATSTAVSVTGDATKTIRLDQVE